MLERDIPPAIPLRPRGSAEILRGRPAELLLIRLDRATIVVGLDGVVVYANPACERLLGYRTAKVLEGHSLGELLVEHSDTPPRDLVELLRDTCAVISWNHSDGYAVATLASDPVFLRSADPMLMVSLTDVSDRVWSAVDRANRFAP